MFYNSKIPAAKNVSCCFLKVCFTFSHTTKDYLGLPTFTLFYTMLMIHRDTYTFMVTAEAYLFSASAATD